MTNADQKMIARISTLFCLNSRNVAIFIQKDFFHFFFKMKLDALFYHIVGDRGDDLSYVICADVGMILIGDLRIGAMGNKDINDVTDVRIFDAGRQFGIRECTGTAFTELNIGRNIQDPFFKEQGHILFSFLNAFSFFKDQNFITGLH